MNLNIGGSRGGFGFGLGIGGRGGRGGRGGHRGHGRSSGPAGGRR
jgi:hypothetical protein